MLFRTMLISISAYLGMQAHYKCTLRNNTDTAYTVVYSNKNGHMRTKTVAPDDTFTIRHHDNATYTITGYDITNNAVYFLLHDYDIKNLIKQKECA